VNAVEEEWHVAEEVVEDVGLDDVVELFRPTQPYRDGEAPIREMREERIVGNQAGHSDDLPAGGGPKLLGNLVEAGNLARRRLQLRDGVDPFRTCIARHELRLPLEEPAIKRMLLRRVAGPVLLDNVVGSRAGIVAAQLGCLHAAGLRTPRRTWSSSIDSNSAR